MAKFLVKAGLLKKRIVTEIKRPGPQAVLVLEPGEEVELSDKEYNALCILSRDFRENLVPAQGKGDPSKEQEAAEAAAKKEAEAKAAKELKAAEIAEAKKAEAEAKKKAKAEADAKKKAGNK